MSRTDVTERPTTQHQAGPPPADRALGVAYRYISRQERSVAEVRARLERDQTPPAEIDAVIDELTQFGYLDDARYAVLFTQDKRTLESWGDDRIARKLRERGVERDLIEAALAEDGRTDGYGPNEAWPDGEGPLGCAAAGGELGRAVALLRQRFPAGPGDQRDRERAYGVLARKGYGSELAGDAVRAWARSTSAE